MGLPSQMDQSQRVESDPFGVRFWPIAAWESVPERMLAFCLVMLHRCYL